MQTHTRVDPQVAIVGRPRCLTAAVLLASTLGAQANWSTQTHLPGLASARASGLAVWRNELVVGLETNTRLPGVALRHLGRFDGERWHEIGGGVDGPVRAVLAHGGDLWVGGAFRNAGGVRASRIARWDGKRWHAVGAGFDKGVRALIVFRGAVWAAGEFTFSGSTRVGAMARWDGRRWQPVGHATHARLPSVHALATDGTSLFAAGLFTAVGGTAATNVARFDRVRWHALGGGTNDAVSALTMFGGNVIAGGIFKRAGGVRAEGLAAWNGRRWMAMGQGVQKAPFSNAQPDVRSLTVFGGKLYVAGNFGRSGTAVLHSIGLWDGTALRSIGGVSRIRFPFIGATVTWNHRLYCAGDFQSVGRAPLDPGSDKVTHAIASYDGRRWHRFAGGWGVGGDLHNFTRYRGELVAGGAFRSAGGSWRNNLVRFDGNDWRAFGAFDGPVDDMVEFGKELWVVGSFRTVNKIVAKGVARFDGQRWRGVGLGPARCIEVFRGSVYVAGIGNPLRYTGSGWVSVGQRVFGQFNDMQTWGNRLYIGGTQLIGPNLYAWDGRSLAPVGRGTNGAVAALGVHNGKLIVGGRFTVAGGVRTPRIAQWDGSRFSGFGSGIPGTRNAVVLAIASLNGELIVGGSFATSAGGNLSRWQGTRWSALPGGALLGGVLALQADDRRRELHVGGKFLYAAGRPSPNYAVWQRAPRFVDLRSALGTPRRTPALTLRGSLQPRATLHIGISSANEASLALLVLGARRADIRLFGGVLVPAPNQLVALTTDAIGRAAADVMGVPPGLRLWMQAWILDSAAPAGFSATNAIELRAP